MTDASAKPQRRGAAPSTEAVDSLFELVCKAHSAAFRNRFLRSAEYFERVALAVGGLWGDKAALCSVLARLQQSGQLVSHSLASTAMDDATWREAQRLVGECRRILNARLSANTCLSGRCFAVEENFYYRYSVLLCEEGAKALNSDNFAAFGALQRVEGYIGYRACMQAACMGIQFVYPVASFIGAQDCCPPLTVDDRNEAQAFALRCVSIMAANRGGPAILERLFAPQIRDLWPAMFWRSRSNRSSLAYGTARRCRARCELGAYWMRRMWQRGRNRIQICLKRRWLPMWRRTAYGGARFRRVPSKRKTCSISRDVRRARRLCTAVRSTRRCTGRTEIII